jgi:hypothetical protein
MFAFPRAIVAASAIGVFCWNIPANAATVSYTATSGSLAASATFDNTVANQLTVTLTNTSLTDVLVPTGVLTALFFSTTASLTPGTATVAPGSSVLFYTPSTQSNVGGEWAYASGLSGAPGGATNGISSSGLNLFGAGNFQPPTNLQGPVSVDGLQFGITSAGDNPATGNTPVTGTNALIKNSVIFVLSLVGVFDLSSLTHVSFQYGTALTDPNVSCTPGAPNCIFHDNTPPPPSVPLPPAAILFVSGLAGLGLIGARRRRRRA